MLGQKHLSSSHHHSPNQIPSCPIRIENLAMGFLSKQTKQNIFNCSSFIIYVKMWNIYLLVHPNNSGIDCLSCLSFCKNVQLLLFISYIFILFLSKVLIIGAGPCGLRTAIECAFLGAKTVIVEKRDRFSRNNVLHLWPYLISDLKNLGAKKFFGKFCAGTIDHISK